MAEKFPPIEDLSIEPTEGDFLARERAALGDEFATEADPVIDDIADEEPEFEQREASPSPEVEKDEEVFEDYASAPAEESAAVKEWKAKRVAEVEEKDKISAQKHDEIVTEARNLIDQFYEDYNAKKELKISKVKEEEAEFLAKRDEFFKNDDSVWERSIKLLELKKSSGSVSDGRDKTKFKEILLSLKGKQGPEIK